MVGVAETRVNHTHRLCTTFNLPSPRLARGQARRGAPRRDVPARPNPARTALSCLILAVALGACADEGGPSFAPDAATETAISALTPAATATRQVIDQQPGEVGDADRTLADLSAGRGTALAVSTRQGDTVILYDSSTGTPRLVQLQEPTGLVAVATSNDGSTIVALRRQASSLVLERIGAAGERLSTLDLAGPAPATPSAVAGGTPVAAAAVTRDRLELSPDGRHVAVVSAEGDLTIATVDPTLAVARAIEDFGDVTALGWAGDGTLALVATYDPTRSTGNLTGVPLEGRLRSILRLPAEDGRRILFLSSPVGSADVFYVARSADDDWTAQNNLYRIPLIGGSPSVVLATGLAGPAGAVDRFAVADDGRTVAASLLIPRGDELVFHSLWVTELGGGRPLEVETGPLGLIIRMGWTPEGLFVVGVQRERDELDSRLVTVSLRLDEDGSLIELGRSQSAATPVASPIGSPAAATPVASPAG